MEPVEIDIRMKQNVDTESEKAVKGVDSITVSSKAAVEAAKAAVTEQKNVIKQIESDMAAIEKQLTKAAPGNAKDDLVRELQSAKQALAEEKASLGDYSTKVDEAAGSNARLRTQVMEAKDALAKMEMAGKRGTPEYAAQAKVLGDLNDQMQDTNSQAKILADDQRGFKAVSGAVSILTGTMTAGVGVAAAFGAKDEDLARIQTRLQAVMAITIGLEQVANALDKDQYFNVVLVTKAKQGWAAAQTFLNTQLGISVGLSKALMVGGIGLLIAGVGTLIYTLSSLSSANKDAAKEAKEFGEKTADGVSKPMAQIQSLSDRWSSLGDNLKEKKKFIDDNKDAFKTLGVEINTVSDAENLLNTNKGAFIEAIIAKAKAAAGMELAAAKYKAAMEKMFEADKMSNTVDVYTSTGGQSVSGGGTMNKTTVKNNEKEAKIKEHNELLAEGDRFIRESDAQTKKADDALAKGNIKKYVEDKKEREKATKEVYDAEKELQKLILDINAETSKLRLDQQADSLQKRLAAIDLEKQEEIRKITEKETAIVEAYNKNHKDDKGFVALSTDASTLSASVSKIDPKRGEELATATTNVSAAYDAKRLEETRRFGEEMTNLAKQFADERVQIMHDYNADIVKLVQAGELEAAGLATIARDKQVSDVTFGLIQETKAYKIATDEKYNLGKELNEKLVVQIKERVAAELAAGKLTKKDVKEILDTVERSQAPKVSGSLSDYIGSIGKLKKAKEDLAKAKVSGDLDGAKKASDDITNLTTTVETYGQKLQTVFSVASEYANQAVGLLDAISTEEGDAASSAAKSIGTVMNIAGNAVSSLSKGDYVGAAIGVITGTLTAIFSAEKAHQQALAAIAKAKADTQKEYNDLLMKQNDLLEKAQNIFGTSKLTEANAYVAQIAAYGKAKDDAVNALSGATVQTGSHKTGLFGWGGEKADYSSLLKTYPLLINSQGELNTELATSILANEKLNDTSKEALQSALDYTEEYQSALDSLKSYLSGIFGSLSDDLMTVIFDNLDNSKSAVDEFQDYVGNAMKKMISDLAQQIFFAQMFSDLSDKVLAVYKDTSLSNEAKTAQVTSAVGAFYNGIGQATSDATKFINDMYGSIKTTTGIDLSASTETARTGTTKGIATASQDSVDENNANLYALRMIGADSRNYVREQLLILRTMSSQLDRIADNTEYCKLLENIKQYLEDMNIKGIKVKV